jgi:hypothetical protein
MHQGCSFELTMQVRNSKYVMYRHVIVWIDLPSQTCIIIKSIPGRVEELRILIVIGVNTPVKDLPALQLRYLIPVRPVLAIMQIYPESFSTEMIYRHLLRTDSGNNREFNCQKANHFAHHFVHV